MAEAPERIWATINGASTCLPDGARQFVGGWSEDSSRPRAVEYIRADKLEELTAERERQYDENVSLIMRLTEKDKEIAALNKKFEMLKQAYDRERQRPIQIVGSNAGGKDGE